MRAVIQRSKKACVVVSEKKIGKIDHGYVIFVGFTSGDDKQVVDKMIEKIINLRIFSDENDKLNLSLLDVGGSVLSISQFTLYAKLNGRRPSFTDALNYKDAKELYEYFNHKLKLKKINVETGEFGSDMKVSLVNDGPITITIDSKEVF